jgi:hypothetical protein
VNDKGNHMAKKLIQRAGFKIATSGGFLLFACLVVLSMPEDMGLSEFVFDFARACRWIGGLAACFGLGLLYSGRDKG